MPKAANLAWPVPKVFRRYNSSSSSKSVDTQTLKSQVACLNGADASTQVALQFQTEESKGGNRPNGTVLEGCLWHDSSKGSVRTATYFSHEACVKGKWDFEWVGFEVHNIITGPSPAAFFRVECVIYWSSGQRDEFSGRAVLWLRSGDLLLLRPHDQTVQHFLGPGRRTRAGIAIRGNDDRRQIRKQSERQVAVTNKIGNKSVRDIPWLHQLYISGPMLTRELAARQGPSLFAHLVGDQHIAQQHVESGQYGAQQRVSIQHEQQGVENRQYGAQQRVSIQHEQQGVENRQYGAQQRVRIQQETRQQGVESSKQHETQQGATSRHEKKISDSCQHYLNAHLEPTHQADPHPSMLSSHPKTRGFSAEEEIYQDFKTHQVLNDMASVRPARSYWWSHDFGEAVLAEPPHRLWNRDTQRARTVASYNSTSAWCVRDKLWHSKHMNSGGVNNSSLHIAGATKWFSVIENDVKRIRMREIYHNHSHDSNLRSKVSNCDQNSKHQRRRYSERPNTPTEAKCNTHTDLQRQMVRFVLQCIAFSVPEIGYCQGLHHLVQYLLQNSSRMHNFVPSLPTVGRERSVAESAVLNLLLLFEDPIYQLRELYSPGFALLHSLLGEFDRRLSVMEPTLHSHFKEIGINSAMYATKWFLTLFSLYVEDETDSRLMQNLFLRFLNSGWTVIVNVAVTTLSCIKALVINQDIEHCLPILGFNADNKLPNPLRLVLGTDIGQEILERNTAVFKKRMSASGNEEFIPVMKPLDSTDFIDPSRLHRRRTTIAGLPQPPEWLFETQNEGSVNVQLPNSMAVDNTLGYNGAKVAPLRGDTTDTFVSTDFCSDAAQSGDEISFDSLNRDYDINEGELGEIARATSREGRVDSTWSNASRGSRASSRRYTWSM